MALSEQVRVGMVGAGAVARRHAANLDALGDARVTAVADVDRCRAEELAARCGAVAYPCFEALLDDQALDAVYVCIPPFAHGPPELAAIQAGLPLFVEKPVAIDLPTAEEIAAAARERGVLTAVGYHWRYLDTVERARELLRDHPPRLVVGYWLDAAPASGWWGTRSRSGGQVVEQATHVLDLLRFVAGEVSEVSARQSHGECTRLPGSDIAHGTSATLRLENGAVGALVSTCLLRGRHRAGLEVFGDGMALELSEDDQRSGDEARLRIDRAFIDSVRGIDDDIRVPYEEALATQRLACAVTASADAGGRPLPVRRRRARAAAVLSLGVARPGQAALFELPVDGPAEHGFRVETLYTGLSAGTELTLFKGTNPYLSLGWDPELGVFGMRRPDHAYPVRTMGYMEVGRVLASNVGAVGSGERVAMAYGHKTSHEADPAHERFVPLPADLDPLLGIYVAHMGPICANGLLHAAAEFAKPEVMSLGDGVRGRHVLVMGAGVVGLLTALFAAHHGAASVTVACEGARRLRAAQRLGLDVVDRRRSEVWPVVKARHRHGPADHGADVAFQCRARPESLAEALRSLRPQGTVIDLAFYAGGADALRLGEEFHHNGLTVRSAQIGRVPRGLSASWNRERLSAETLELLRAHGDAIRREVVTDVVPLEAAPRLLDDIAARRRRDVIQVVFEVSGCSCKPT
jgi:predicted dehydrogenase/threonine dehydrogenase-like Zn-dependent dehydrogenase